MVYVFGAYAHLVAFLLFLWLLIVATALIYFKFVFPIMKDLPKQNVRVTLGFYVYSFLFLYCLYPFFLKNHADSVTLYKDVLNNLWQMGMMFTTFYVGKAIGNNEQKS